MNKTLKSVWLKSENLDNENKNYELKILDAEDENEIDFVRAQVIENIFNKVDPNNPECKRILKEFENEIIEETLNSVLEVVEGHHFFSENAKKFAIFLKKNDEFRKKLFDKYVGNVSNIFLIDKWKVVKGLFKDFTEKTLETIREAYNKEKEISKHYESHLDLLKKSNKNYEEDIELATNTEKLKEIFRNILQDGILLDNVKKVAIQIGEEMLKSNESSSDVFSVKISNNLGDIHEEEMKKKLSVIVKDYLKEINKKKSIVDIIALANEKSASLSVQFLREIILGSKVKITYLNINGEEVSSKDKDFSKIIESIWLLCEKCPTKINDGKELVNYAHWENHLQNHTNSFFENLIDLVKICELLEWIDGNGNKLFGIAKEQTIKKAKEKVDTTGNLEELIEKMTIIEQVDNFREWFGLEEENIRLIPTTYRLTGSEKENGIMKRIEFGENQLELENVVINQKQQEEKQKLKDFLNDYIVLAEEKIRDLADLSIEDKRQEYEAKVEQIKIFIPKIDNWK